MVFSTVLLTLPAKTQCTTQREYSISMKCVSVGCFCLVIFSLLLHELKSAQLFLVHVTYCIVHNVYCIYHTIVLHGVCFIECRLSKSLQFYNNSINSTNLMQEQSGAWIFVTPLYAICHIWHLALTENTECDILKAIKYSFSLSLFFRINETAELVASLLSGCKYSTVQYALTLGSNYLYTENYHGLLLYSNCLRC